MEELMRILSLFLLTAALFISCNQSQDGSSKIYYYPSEHNTPISDKKGNVEIYAQWGEKLAYQNEVVTNVYGNKIKVKRVLDGTIGYVDEEDVVEQPVARGVILQSILVYGSPSSSYSSEKIQVNPPVLVYITDTNETGWVKFESYNPDGIYNLEDVTKITGMKWVKWDKISTNSEDIEVIIAIQHSLAEYRQASQDDELELKKVIDTQKKFLSDDIISGYSQSSAVSFAEEVYEIIANNSEKEEATETNAGIDEDEIFDIIQDNRNKKSGTNLSQSVSNELRSAVTGDTNKPISEDESGRSEFYRPPPGK